MIVFDRLRGGQGRYRGTIRGGPDERIVRRVLRKESVETRTRGDSRRETKHDAF
jgi:hypothetical protein